MMIECIAHRAEGEAHLDTGIGTLLWGKEVPSEEQRSSSGIENEKGTTDLMMGMKTGTNQGM
jgi:hypothetical protein